MASQCGLPALAPGAIGGLLAPLAGDWIAYQAWEDPTQLLRVVRLGDGELIYQRVSQSLDPSRYVLILVLRGGGHSGGRNGPMRSRRRRPVGVRDRGDVIPLHRMSP